MYGLHFVSRKFPITLNINNRFLAFVLQKRCAQVVFLLHCVEFIRFFHGKNFISNILCSRGILREIARKIKIYSIQKGPVIKDAYNFVKLVFFYHPKKFPKF